MKKPLPIGVDNYRKMIDRGYYYVDKTLLIKEVLDQGGEVNLITRPRRFGKTLAQSMLQTYFEAAMDIQGKPLDQSHYFAGTKIMAAGEEYTRHLGQYPVISLSMKSAKQPNYEMAYKSLVKEIAGEYDRHQYVLQGDMLHAAEREMFLAMRDGKADAADYATAVQFLSKCLEKHHQQKTVILIDEYDVPLENAYFEGFYSQMIKFVRSLFESALKTNNSLAFAVVTGCLRISRESIFTGLNNLEVISVLNNNYAEHFGFVQSEVDAMLDFYEISNLRETAKEWYDGYLFGQTEVYNPWSVINYVKTAVTDAYGFPRPYWANTSSNSIVRELVEQADAATKQELELLLQGGSIEKPVHEDITYEDIHKTPDNLWNFLFFTGYLKMVSQRFEGEDIYLTMTIPNVEVRSIYRRTIAEWFEAKLKTADRTPLQQALLAGDCEALTLLINRQLMGSISYYDSSEAFYHGYLLGMLQDVPDYFTYSNREAGNGRPDLQLISADRKEPAIVIEIKRADSYADMAALCEQALAQIQEQQYTAELRLQGYQHFWYYGICFCKKSCKILCEKDDV